MAGLLGHLAAGLATGAGQGMVQQAQARREQFLENLRHERRQAERQEDRAWQVEDRDLAFARRGSGGGGGGSSAPAAVQTLEYARGLARAELGDAATEAEINQRAREILGGASTGRSMSVSDYTNIQRAADEAARQHVGARLGTAIRESDREEYQRFFDGEVQRLKQMFGFAPATAARPGSAPPGGTSATPPASAPVDINDLLRLYGG